MSYAVVLLILHTVANFFRKMTNGNLTVISDNKLERKGHKTRYISTISRKNWGL